MSRNNHFSFQTLCPEKDENCVASGTKPLEELSLAPDVFCMGYKCSGSRLPRNNSEFFLDFDFA